MATQDGNGQFELNWDYGDCLATADKHVFFKFMVKSVAEKHGKASRAVVLPVSGSYTFSSHQR